MRNCSKLLPASRWRSRSSTTGTRSSCTGGPAARASTHSDALDLVSELFARAWVSRKRFRDPGDGDRGPAGCSESPATSSPRTGAAAPSTRDGEEAAPPADGRGGRRERRRSASAIDAAARRPALERRARHASGQSARGSSHADRRRSRLSRASRFSFAAPRRRPASGCRSGCASFVLRWRWPGEARRGDHRHDDVPRTPTGRPRARDRGRPVALAPPPPRSPGGPGDRRHGRRRRHVGGRDDRTLLGRP